MNIKVIIQTPQPVPGSSRVVEPFIPELGEDFGDDDFLEDGFDVFLGGGGVVAFAKDLCDNIVVTLLG